MLRYLIAIAVLLISQAILAQDGNDDFKFNSELDTIVKGEVQYVFHDQRIPQLDSMARLSPPKLQGYRLQIFFGDKRKARKMRTEFKRAHPKTGAYISYLAPNFKLRVGDFRSKLECQKFKAQVRQKYPSSYIVHDKIELPPLESKDDSLNDRSYIRREQSGNQTE